MFKIGIERPRQDANALARDLLLRGQMIRSVLCWREDQAGAAKSTAAERRQRLPDFDSVRDNDRLHLRCRDAHPLDHRRQIWMRRDDQFCVPPRGSQRSRRKSSLRSFAASEDELAIAHRHAMQFRRVVQAQQPAFHLSALGKLRDHRCQMPPCSLDPAG